MTLRQRNSGFTIVELLIVIVVIGILAAITIVAYNGVQNRAHDTAVQADVSNFSKKAELFYVDHSQYPDPTDSALSDLGSLGFRPSAGSYMEQPGVSRNLLYCATADLQHYGLFMKSKSGNAYYVSNATGGTAKPYTATWDASTSGGAICQSALIGAPQAVHNQAAGYTSTGGGWQTWTGLGD